MEKVEPKKNWTINPDAFQRLLDWLDEGKPSDGQKYLEMRERLVAYFDRKNCRAPEELTDETLNRVARRLEEEGTIVSETAAKYCYITGRFVFMESLRGADKVNISLDELEQNGHRRQQLAAVEADREEKELKEKMLGCLEKCTENLDAVSREIIVNYYFGAERVKIDNRRALAQKFDISVNALSIRACRIRDKLEVCVEKCMGKT